MHRCLVFLVLFLLGCGLPPVPAVSVVPQPLTIHADTDFTQAERALIHQATRELMSQISLRVDVIYDLDFGKVEQPTGVILLIRADRGSELTQQMDIRFKGITYGWTMGINWKRAFIVSDVLGGGGETLFLHVVIHEFLHLVGCEHVSDPNAVLFWSTDNHHKAIRLTEADRLELLRVTRPSPAVALGE